MVMFGSTPPASAVSAVKTASGAWARAAVRSEFSRYASASSGSASPSAVRCLVIAAASPRDGSVKGGLPALQRVVQRRPGQWGEHPLRQPRRCVADQLLAKQFLAGERGAQRIDAASSTTVMRWFAPCASAAW